MTVQAQIDAHASKRIMAGLMAEARAIVTGASFEVAARVGADLAGAGKARECAPRMTEDRTVAVNAAGKRNPWNARGMVAPGSTSLRAKDGHRQRRRSIENAHAGTQDAIKRDLERLGRLCLDLDRAKGRDQKRGAQMACRAVARRIMSTRGMLLDIGREAGPDA